MPSLSSFGGMAAIGLGARSKAPFVATGGTITTDGAYTVHTFTASGTFTVLSGEKDIDYMVVGGGGSGGCIDNYGCGGGLTGSGHGVGGAVNAAGTNGANYASGSQNANGGGGGGGCGRWGASHISASLSVTVGAGGLVGSNNAGASTFNDITSNGGQKGGNAATLNGGVGGTGGPAGTGTGGSLTPNSIAAPSTYGKGGDGNWSPAAQPGNGGVVVIKYLTAG